MGLITKEKYNVNPRRVYDEYGKLKYGIKSVEPAIYHNVVRTYSLGTPVKKVEYGNYQLTERGKLVFTTGFAIILYAGVKIASALKLIP